MTRKSPEEAEARAVIAARGARLGGQTAWSALGSVEQFAAVVASGFDPVGHVLGTTVLHLGNLSSRGKCSGSWMYTGQTDLASRNGPFQGLMHRLTGARRLALKRALAECGAQHGDGIIGAHLAVTYLGPNILEFTVQGTAVRARSRSHLESPFSTHVPGPEFAALLRSGWMPVSVVYAVAIGSHHDGGSVLAQTRRRLGASGNGEVTAYSRLVNDTRRNARDLLKKAVGEQNGEGVVVDEMTLRISERECPSNEGEHDHVAEAAIAGTALVAFSRGPSAGRGTDRAPLAMLHLDARTGEEQLTEQPQDAHARLEIAEGLTDRQSRVDRLAVMLRFRRARKDPFVNYGNE